MDELNFQIEFLSVDRVIAGGVEDQLLQHVLSSLINKSISIPFVDWGGEVVSGVE